MHSCALSVPATRWSRESFGKFLFIPPMRRVTRPAVSASTPLFFGSGLSSIHARVTRCDMTHTTSAGCSGRQVRHRLKWRERGRPAMPVQGRLIPHTAHTTVAAEAVAVSIGAIAACYRIYRPSFSSTSSTNLSVSENSSVSSGNRPIDSTSFPNTKNTSAVW